MFAPIVIAGHLSDKRNSVIFVVTGRPLTENSPPLQQFLLLLMNNHKNWHTFTYPHKKFIFFGTSIRSTPVHVATSRSSVPRNSFPRLCFLAPTAPRPTPTTGTQAVHIDVPAVAEVPEIRESSAYPGAYDFVTTAGTFMAYGQTPAGGQPPQRQPHYRRIAP